MSLKFFHIFFITAALSLALYLGWWSYVQKWPIGWSALWFVLAAALGVYLVWFLKKIKDLR